MGDGMDGEGSGNGGLMQVESWTLGSTAAFLALVGRTVLLGGL